MVHLPSIEEMYSAVERKDDAYVGIFVVAVKTTKIFCLPGCPARPPLAKNVEFFATGQEALAAGYRPCLRCKPMDPHGVPPAWVTHALQELETDPNRRLKAQDLRDRGVQPERLSRWFKKNYGMTFQAYARARRLGDACHHLRNGKDVIEAGMDAGYDSTSGFREAFHRLFGDAPTRTRDKAPLTAKWIETPLGPMFAVASNDSLCLLEFVDRRMLETQISTLRGRVSGNVVPGDNAILEKLGQELGSYFSGSLKEFSVPLHLSGSGFQERVWNRLLEIPYGRTASYSEMARDLGLPDAQRAVGKANGDNRIAILVPCHRVIKADGTLCGYGGGVWRKQRLLELESGQLTL